MSQNFTRDQTKLAVAKILQTLGWNSINSTPLEILTDVLGSFIEQITKGASSYANEFGCTQPNLDHLGLTLHEMGTNLGDLEEYVKYVNFGPPPSAVPKYPILKEDHLNFLKPGSKEVVMRPVHIHEHLPPMNPLLEGPENDTENVATNMEESDENNPENGQIFKKPADMVPVEFKRPSFPREEESSRPTREMSSVMMTSSGFISPSREGKLPESRTPSHSIDPIIPLHPTVETIDLNKKPVKNVKRVEKKKLKNGLVITTSSPLLDEKKRKMAKMNWLLKSKQPKIPASILNSLPSGTDVKISPVPNKVNNQVARMNKALAAARLKTEKLNTTITPITIKPVSSQLVTTTSTTAAAATTTAPATTTTTTTTSITTVAPTPTNTTTAFASTTTSTTVSSTTIAATVVSESENIDKLFTEPDKKKVNIFKKISNVKNEKVDNHKINNRRDDIRLESRTSSPEDLIIDEPEDNIVSKLPQLPSDVTIEPINPMGPFKNLDKFESTPFFDVGIPLVKPSTPKTPEIITHSPPVVREKKKRKDSRRIKKVQKHLAPNHMDNGHIPMDLERPKTPEAQLLSKLDLPLNHLHRHPLPPAAASLPFPFLTNFGGPGLIPPALAGPLFPPLPFPSMNLPHFGQKPHLSPFHPPPVSSIPNINPSLNVVPAKVERQPSPLPPVSPQVQLPTTSTKPVHKNNTNNSSNIDNNDDTGKVSSTTTISEPLMLSPSSKPDKKSKEHKKDKKDKIKKRNKKDKVKNKAEKKKLKEEKKEKIKKEKKEKRKDKEFKEADSSLNVKITLKLKSPSPRPETPETTRKLNIKPIVKKEDEPVPNHTEERHHRETSPGLAKISALVKGPPKPKPMNLPVSQSQAFNDSFPSSSSDNFVNQMKKTMSKPISKIRTKEIRREPVEVPIIPPAPHSKYIDAAGNEVWICPACGRQDDGSPMIGCDGCDAWYHWVCVGIQVPPDDNEDWYCRHCLLRKNEDLQSDKQKKKRKKREKKEH